MQQIDDAYIESLDLEALRGSVVAVVGGSQGSVGPAEPGTREQFTATELSGTVGSEKHSQPLWLWVFLSATMTLYYVAGRGKELVKNVLAGFTGWLMSDGWIAYRHYPRRLRSWGERVSR